MRQAARAVKMTPLVLWDKAYRALKLWKILCRTGTLRVGAVERRIFTALLNACARWKISLLCTNLRR
jgi:hypothetical protein